MCVRAVIAHHGDWRHVALIMLQINNMKLLTHIVGVCRIAFDHHRAKLISFASHLRAVKERHESFIVIIEM